MVVHSSRHFGEDKFKPVTGTMSQLQRVKSVLEAAETHRFMLDASSRAGWCCVPLSAYFRHLPYHKAMADLLARRPATYKSAF